MVVIAFHPWPKQREEEQVERAALSAVLLRCTYAAWLLRLGNHQWQGGGGGNIRWLSWSVCGCQRRASLHVRGANVKHEAEETPQSDATGARGGVTLTHVNLSTVISDIKGQAVHSRWFFCWTVSLVLDSDLILCKWKLLTRLCCQTRGNFHTAKCASRRTWTHAQHN